MPKAVWWALISGIAAVVTQMLQEQYASWQWTPVIVGLIGVLLMAVKTWLDERKESAATQSRGFSSFEDAPKPQSWARKVLW